MGALTAMPVDDWPVDHSATATEVVRRLAHCAHDVVAAAADPASAARAAAVLAAISDGAALARDLAALASPGDDATPAAIDPVACAERFLAALAAVAAAVYVCRRVRHPGHECLFGDDGLLCRRVLVAAHALGERSAR